MQFAILKKVDKLGSITIPKEYRDFYHLHEKESVCVVAMENGVLITNPKYKVVEVQSAEEE